MTRRLPIALVSIVLAALAAWHYGGNVDSSRDGNVAPATPARTWSEARTATPVSRPGQPASVGPQASAGQSVAEIAASGVLPLQPAGTTIDPATGAVVVRPAREDGDAMVSPGGALPDDVEIDQATGVATSR